MGILFNEKYIKYIDELYEKGSRAGWPLVGVASLGIAVVSFAYAVIKDLEVSTTWKISIVAALILVSLSILRQISLKMFDPQKFPKPLGEHKRFLQIGKTVGTIVFSRETLVKKMRSEIKSAKGLVTIVSGKSGSGKSYLMTELLQEKADPPKEEEVNHINGFSTKDIFISSVKMYLESKCIDPKISDSFATIPALDFTKVGEEEVLIVFDQFEQFLKYTETSANPKELNRWFGKLVEELRSHDMVRCVIVVRKDYYYELMTFLQETCSPEVIDDSTSDTSNDDESIPGDSDEVKQRPFQKTLSVPEIPFENDTESADCGEFFAELGKFLDSQERPVVIESAGKMLPIELRIAGFVIEDIFNTSGEDTKKTVMHVNKLEGMDQLVRKYFMRHVDSAPHRQTALGILFALSHGVTMRQELTSSELAQILMTTKDKVDQVLEILSVRLGLIGFRHNKYHIYHDYLAERFIGMSGLLLDPTFRDNITFFCDDRYRNMQMNNTQEELVTEIKHPLLPRLLFGGVIAILFVRLFAPSWFSPEFLTDLLSWKRVVTVPLISDPTILGLVSYFPAFATSVVAAIYIGLLNRNFFLLMKVQDEKQMKKQNRLNNIQMYGSVFIILLGTIIHHLWLPLAAFGGWIIKYRFGKTCKGLSQEVAKENVNVLRRTSTYFGYFLFTLTLFGALIVALYFGWIPSDIGSQSLIASDTPYHVKLYLIEALSKFGPQSSNVLGATFFFLELVFATGYTIFMAFAIKEHAVEDKGALFLGIWKRLSSSDPKSANS